MSRPTLDVPEDHLMFQPTKGAGKRLRPGAPAATNGPPERRPVPGIPTPASLVAAFARLMARHPAAACPACAWGLLHAAHLARAVDQHRISAVALGVGGARRLLSLRRLAGWVGSRMGVVIDAYGVAEGVGLARPREYRGDPALYTDGPHRGELTRLQASRRRGDLIVGPADETVARFLAGAPAPVGFAAITVDGYAPALHALGLFAADPAALLPQVYCCIDDGPGLVQDEFARERLAIEEFNRAHPRRRVVAIPQPAPALPGRTLETPWADMRYVVHCLDHPLYPAASRRAAARMPAVRRRAPAATS